MTEFVEVDGIIAAEKEGLEDDLVELDDVVCEVLTHIAKKRYYMVLFRVIQESNGRNVIF